MHLLRTVFLLAAMASPLGAVTLQLTGDQDPGCSSGYICINNGSFSFTVNGSGGGYFKILNGDMETYTSLDIEVPYLNPNCPNALNIVTLIIDPSFTGMFGQGGFSDSASTVCVAGETDMAEYILNLTFSPGIGPNLIFNINLNDNTSSVDPTGSGGWLANGTSTDSASAPEPGTFAIGASGLLLLGVVWKRAWKRRYCTSFRNSGSADNPFKSGSPAASFRE